MLVPNSWHVVMNVHGRGIKTKEVLAHSFYDRPGIMKTEAIFPEPSKGRYHTSIVPPSARQSLGGWGLR